MFRGLPLVRLTTPLVKGRGDFRLRCEPVWEVGSRRRGASYNWRLMNPPSGIALPVESTAAIEDTHEATPRGKGWEWCLVVAALGIPASLLWDFSWECTVGIDLPWAAPHVATYAAVALAAVVALSELRFGRSTDR